MEKRKFSLPINKWGTIKSKYQPESNYVSPDEFTVGSSNFITNVTGAIEKRPTDVQYSSASLTNPGKDQFEAIFVNGSHHLMFMDGGTLKYTSGDTLLHDLKAGYTPAASMEYAMYQNRVYFDNGIDAADVYDLTTSYGGVSYSLPQVKAVGAQAPTTAPTFTADTAGGSVPEGGHTYKITFLYYGFEESNGSPASALRTVSAPNQKVNLVDIPIGGYGVTARKIYRDDNDGNYLLVGTLSNNTATGFTDLLSVGATPTALPTTNNVPPVFSYIVLNFSRLWVAGVSGTPTTLYWSNPGLPDIFDPTNFVLCNPKDPVQALAVYQGTVYVFNRHSFGQILGNTSDTFYYQEFPGSVGCVDNRSIQIRTINGVPTLIFLSDRGLYSFNGSSVEYISDDIEDEVNLNIQQVNFVTGSNAQSSQADFQGGTASASIDLTSDPGVITTDNPQVIYQSDADWEGGLVLTNAATKDGLNTLKEPTLFAPTLASGTLGGSAQITSSVLTLPLATNFTGQDNYSFTVSNIPGSYGVFFNALAMAQPIAALTRSGTITSISVPVRFEGVTHSVKLTIWTDTAGSPGSIVYQGGVHTVSSSSDLLITETISLAISSGVSFWIGYVTDAAPGGGGQVILDSTNTTFGTGSPKVYNGTSWTTMAAYAPSLASIHSGRVVYTFSQTAVPKSGTWVSPIFDSQSISIKSFIFNVGSNFYPTNTTGTILLEATNDPLFLTGISSVNAIDLSSGYPVSSLQDLRYFRFTWTISTTDDRGVPAVNAPAFTSYGTCTWTSQVISVTSDFTAYDDLVMASVGSGNTVQIATSANGTSFPDGFVDFGTETPREYAKFQIVINGQAHSVSSLTFTWILGATFESSIINTGQIPSGWGLFQNVSALNGGTLIFELRSAATSGAVSGATYYTVVNGQFPASVPVNQYTQWRLSFVSAADDVPTVDSVTVNWFIGSSASPIRVASLFFNKTYYLAAAETSQPTNNVVIVWDWEGNWRLFRGLNINSLGLFFNQPFYLDGLRTEIYQWLIDPDGTGSAIEMDIRTRAWDFADSTHLKSPRSLRVMGLNTGTTIHAYYSIDRGVTWIEMLNVAGATGFATTADGSKFYEYFVPDYSLGNTTLGVTVMYRVTSTDAYPCTILALEPEINIRAGKYLGRAI